MAAHFDLPDPRRWTPGEASPQAAALHAAVSRRLALTQAEAGERADAGIDAVLSAWLAAGDGRALAAAFACAPAVDVHRHLWRRLAAVEPAASSTAALAGVLFAIPVVIVAGPRSPGEPVTLPATLVDVQAVSDLLREHGALAAEARVALSPGLVAADALDLPALPALCAHARALVSGAPPAPLALAGAPLHVEGPHEAAHLRFVVGFGICAPQAQPLRTDAAPALGLALTRALSRELVTPGATVLALPERVMRLVPALAAGRAAQRAVALELFAGNALRRLRAGYGEPTAVLSAHTARDAPGGGELRLSLSSVFAPREAEGLRYPLQPYERVPDAITAIVSLLEDCRVSDVRAMPGVQPDRDAATGLLRFCRPDEAERTVH